MGISCCFRLILLIVLGFLDVHSRDIIPKSVLNSKVMVRIALAN